ncbi:hypothetical protein [Sphingobacterium haloxyli]|nr:hypothetical protein [Sphingobacterium haloxyli]
MKQKHFLQIFLMWVYLCIGVTANGQTATFNKQVVASATNKPELTDGSNQSLIRGGLYRVKLSVAPTGTMTGAEFLAWYDGSKALWQLRMVTAGGTTSNHPMLEVENNVVKVSTKHANNYTVLVFAEYFATGNTAARPTALGASYHWQRLANRLYYMDGNVGIGTVDPKAKLSVEGNILAKEIKVTNNIAVPDYVFEPEYELPSLSAIEAYVKEHKHLPDIPSAREIAEQGLDVGEMNLLLLKKVEELTLHLIEKEKKMKKMETVADRVTELEEKLRKMEELLLDSGEHTD